MTENNKIKKEELLAIAAQQLEMDATRKQRVESAYRTINQVLDKDDSFFEPYTVLVYAQGSLRIGTTVKPMNGEDYDLDIVVDIRDSYLNHTPDHIYEELYRVLNADGRYEEKLERKNRCVRINYKDDFHLDALPGCMISRDNTRIMIPLDEKRLEWSRTDPKAFAEWFLEIAKKLKGRFILEKRFNAMVKASVETEDLPEYSIYSKTPLQRTVQIIKRFRDLYYSEKNTSVYPQASSIVLTTIIAKAYEDADSIQEALRQAIKRLEKLSYDYEVYGTKFKVYNPIDKHSDKEKREIFNDSWQDKHYKSFVLFSKALKNAVMEFLERKTNPTTFNNLFGGGFYSDVVQRQIKIDENWRGQPILAPLLTGTARTDRSGKINETKGLKNVDHKFWAE